MSDDGIDVAGPLTLTLDEFKRRCAVHIAEEQAKSLPENSIIGLLCDAVRLTREYEEACVIGRYCSEHGFEHGAEAEYMRAEIERYIAEPPDNAAPDGDVSPQEAVQSALHDVGHALQTIVDRVDARDSLAFLEADERRARAEILRFVAFVDKLGEEELDERALDSYFETRRPAPLEYYEHRQRIYKAPHPEQEGVVDEERCSKVSSDLTERLVNETASPLEAFIVGFMVLKMLPHVTEALLGLTPEQTLDIAEEASRVVRSVRAAVEPQPFTGKGGVG